METKVVEPSWAMVGVLGGARGARAEGEEAIGTEHLLAAVAGAKGRAGEALGLVGATVTAQLAVLRVRQDGEVRWRSADGSADGMDGVPMSRVLGEHAEKDVPLTGAARRALVLALELARREQADRLTPEHLIRALLEDDDSRASEMLRICGASALDVLERLGDPALGPLDDGLHPELWPTRDLLLGRVAEDRSLLRRLADTVTRGVNLASLPVFWLARDSREQARRLGADWRTEHLLLAALAVAEVARRYPHLVGEGTVDPSVRFAGGARLECEGVDYLVVRKAVEHGGLLLGSDDRDCDSYVDAADDDEGTGPLVEALLHGETRARKLLHLLTSDDDDEGEDREYEEESGESADKDGGDGAGNDIGGGGAGSGKGGGGKEKNKDGDGDGELMVGAGEATGSVVEALLRGGGHVVRRIFDALN